MTQSLWHNLAERSRAMADSAQTIASSLKDWTALVPHLRREFAHGLGLEPLPSRCDLRLTDHGRVAGNGFEMRRIAFQILPDCWSTANVYYPAPLPATRCPAVLYVCGHAAIGTHHYQSHGIRWARRGYVCLVLDTIEQGDNPGEHHGSLLGMQDRWLSLGYTPAGGELWNSLRALDVLEADPCVDPDRLAVTGVSGGGAQSFFLAIVDPRVKAVATLCGISSPIDAIAHRHLMGNCDCFYLINHYQRDISVYGALIAPRPALFCFAEHDQLFHLDQVQAMVQRVRRVYALYDRQSHCRLLTCPGPHGDHPEFDEAAAQWFDEHVAGSSRPPLPRGGQELSEAQTSVFQGSPPVPNHVRLLPELLSPHGALPLPGAESDWPALRRDALQKLETCVPGLTASPAPEANFIEIGDWCWAGERRMREHQGRIDGMDLRLHVVCTDAPQGSLVLSMANEGETSLHALSNLTAGLDPQQTGYAGLEPRMSGYVAPASVQPAPPAQPQFRTTRQFVLLGLMLSGATPVLWTVHDARAAASYLLRHPRTAQRRLYLHGRGDGAVAALYAAALDPRIAGVVLEHLPCSHLQAAPIPGICRALDIPHAVGLLAPRRVALVQPAHGNWTWPTRAFDRLGVAQNLIIASDARQAWTRVLA